MLSTQSLAYPSQAMMGNPDAASQRERTETSTRLWKVRVIGFLCQKSNVLLVWRQLNKCSLLDLLGKNTNRLRMFTIVHTHPISDKRKHQAVAEV